MTSNYEAICKENKESYGTKGAKKSGKLAAELYDDRTHFIFELLQNAEDALGRRGEWHGSRKVSFDLTPTALTISHFGKPFDEADVRSVCDIAESTKNEASIGRFGLGFKSVYTVTDLPEIHSGDEDFSIEDYVFPKRLDGSTRAADETQIILPLRSDDVGVVQEITAGFRRLDPSALLFLRHIDEISWSVKGGASGFYLRNSPELLGPNVQRIMVIGKEDDLQEVDQNWLVFHRDVFSAKRQKTGRVEIAFSLVAVNDVSGRWTVQPLAKSPLVVFFPTVVESNLGFLVQGPYRTTPSRDNIPPGEPWNQHLVKETSCLLVDAMCWMRDKAMLDVSALRCLPLDCNKFPKDSRFAPMFDAVRQAFQEQELLPTFEGRHVTAYQAKLARTQEMRELFGSKQVAALFGSEVTAWLSGDITQDKAPEIRQYLMRELGIDEITPTKLMPSLTKSFLEAQSDEWVLRLYEFLSGQEKVLHRHLDTVPLIRLDNGEHVVARENGKAKAFLPSAIATSFPTIHHAVCKTPEVRTFLNSLGITEPDPVDDVIWNILPKYHQEPVDVDDEAYAADIKRIFAAFSTDSTTQKEKLRSALRDTNFVMVVDTGDGQTYLAKPGEVYIDTERLQQLFAGVPGILIVDNEYDCLHSEDIRNLLVSCGASRYLIRQKTLSMLGHSEKAQIRRETGLDRASWENEPEDFTLRGLTQLLELLPTLKTEEAAARVKVLWEALSDLEARGTASFYGSYKWGYFHEEKTAKFDAIFIRTLNQFAWIPKNDGELLSPGFVAFDTLGWKPNPFLQSKIAFKPPIIDQLAKEAGIDPAILELLRRDPAIVAELASRLKTNPRPELPKAPESEADEQSDGNVYDSAKDLYNGNDVDTGRSGHGYSDTGSSHSGGSGNGGAYSSSGGHTTSVNRGSSDNGGQGYRNPGHAGGRPFISYVGTHSNDDNSDPNDPDQMKRMQIEKHAIDLIMGLEPGLSRTPEGNPGFDLFEADSSGNPVRWIEVKSMTGSLEDRPVGLSHTQFNYARDKGDAYWLYVVEYTNNPEKARLLKIQDPVAHAKTFTFDHGWREIGKYASFPQHSSHQHRPETA